MKRTQAGSGDSSGPDYLFSVFRLEADGTLYRGDTAIALAPLELKALRLMLAHAGRAVSQAQLRQALWDGQSAEAGSVGKCINSLQSRLEPYVTIDSVYKRGFRLDAQVVAQGGETAPELPRLAIQPMSVEFGVPRYLGLALAEEVAVELGRARHRAVTIVAQDSVFTLARRGFSAERIGTMLGADLVLAGTVRALPTHYRIEVRMIRTVDGSQLWMEDQLIPRDRLPDLGKELSDCVTYRLREGRLSIIAEVVPPQPEADPLRRQRWENYQQAHQEWQTLERHRMQDAMRRLSQAIELDPELIGARVDLANLCIAQCVFGYMSPDTAAAAIKDAAAPSLARPATPTPMLPMVGWVNFHMDRDLPAALRAFELSAHLPHDSSVTLTRVMFALSRHRMEEAVEILRSTIRLDPWSGWLHGRLIWALHLSGEAEESVKQAVETIARFPEHAAACLYAALVLAHNGDAARAVKLAEEKSGKLPYSDLAAAIFAYSLASSGREEEARGHLERLQWMSQERFVLPSFMVPTNVALGDHDEALKQLRAANRVRCPWFFQLLADPRLRPLHQHAEFQAMQRILPAMEADASKSAALK